MIITLATIVYAIDHIETLIAVISNINMSLVVATRLY